MSKPTKRVRADIKIEYQSTENKAEFINSVIANIVKSLELMGYPNEVINPAKGDFIRLSYSEPKPAKKRA